jgi:hypothetical protein
MSKIIDLYTNPSNPGAFRGLSGFLKNNKNLDKDEVENELLRTNAYTQHILPKTKFVRRKVILPGVDYMWQCDLIDTQKLKYQNSHLTFILTVIDCFSRYAWVRPLKKKLLKIHIKHLKI